jgi:Leucine-rich repeat (LRR) protein
MKTERNGVRLLSLILILVLLALAGNLPVRLTPVLAFGPGDFVFQVDIPDKNLNIALHQACGKPPLLYSVPLTNKELAQLTGKLNLSNMGIKDLEGVQHCVNITELIASYNPLNFLPDMTNMEKLELLYLNNCEFSEVPSAISQIPNLRTLYIHYNKIKDINHLKGCPKLRHLHLGSNQISSFPAGLGLSNLEYIDLHSNKFTAFPQALLEYSKTLDVLHLSNNALKSLPDALGKMPNLRVLSLCSADLSSLPSSLGSSGKLQSLEVANNQLTSLPDALFKSKTLNNLDLHLNRLTQLPEGIANSDYACLDLQLNYLDLSQGSKTLQLINKISAQEKRYKVQLSPIRNLKATPGKDQIKLSWDPCPDATGDPDAEAFVSHYEVFLKEGNKLTSQGSIQKSGTPAFIDKGLAPGMKREYSIAVIYEVSTSDGNFVSRSYSDIAAETPPEETTAVTTEPVTEHETIVTEPTSSMTGPGTTEPPQAEEPEPSAEPEQPGQQEKNKLLPWLILSLSLVLALSAVLVWFLVIRPKRKK